MADKVRRDGCLGSEATEGTRARERRTQEDGRRAGFRYPDAEGSELKKW